jgi:hypothetical protein
MIGQVIAALGLIYDFAEDHPDVVKMLADEARQLLGGHKNDETLPGREAMRGLAAGMAAACSNAVQRAAREGGTGNIERARKVVADWALKTTTRNQLLLQQDAVRELCAELLRDARVRT